MHERVVAISLKSKLFHAFMRSCMHTNAQWAETSQSHHTTLIPPEQTHLTLVQAWPI